MKKILYILSALSFVVFMSCSETTDAANKVKDEANKVMDTPKCGEEGHTCTAACHADDHKAEGKDHVCNDQCKEGKCHTVCGEKGHECSDACHANKKEAKAHVCNDKCVEGKCHKSCGEEGHVCTGECKG